MIAFDRKMQYHYLTYMVHAGQFRNGPKHICLPRALHHHRHHPRISSRRKSWNKTSGPLIYIHLL